MTTEKPEKPGSDPSTTELKIAEISPVDAADGWGRMRLRLVVIGIAAAMAIGVTALYLRAVASDNHVALADTPKPVSTVIARAATFRPLRTYVGTIGAWSEAKLGPQYVSAYVGSVLVRPGAVVKRGQVLATLDCRESSSASKAIAARTRALEEKQRAISHESDRVQQMIAGGFASANEAEQLAARTRSEEAEVESLRASVVSKSLEVDDCIVRAPFDGEIASRLLDPGAFARPGQAVVSVIDRSTVRVVADAPESDFSVVAPGTPVSIEVEAANAKLTATISRRSPAADESTRTVHFEIDLPNPKRELPIGTTARLAIRFGEPLPASLVPLRSATLRGDKAALFIVSDKIAHRIEVPVVGELGADLLLDPKQLAVGSVVVVEGRALLDDRDRVAARELVP